VRAKPVVPRASARQDAEEAIDHYLSQGARDAALGFVEALEQALRHIGRHAASGSPRYAHELEIPGLRFWSMGRYPHLVFYVERADHVDVLRVLHGQRDISSWMRPSEADR
jgi:toxin ParE1/3/4